MANTPIIDRRFIITIEGGWVFCGTCETIDDHHVTYRDVSNIRVWGTERGLGQLALEGATASTVLDPTGKLIVCNHAVLFLIPVTSDL